MFKVLDEVCKPTKGSKYSAAIDLYAREDIVIGAGETVKVPLGVCIDLYSFIKNNQDEFESWIFGKNIDSFEIEFDEDLINEFIKSHYLQLEPRSSLRAKGLQAGTGIIDLDYKDEIMIILHNPTTNERVYEYSQGNEDFGSYKIYKGDKIAQIMLCEHKSYLFGIESDEERKGGFGSTGN